MGKKIIAVFVAAVGVARVVREFINTQYDWILLLAGLICLGVLIPDKFLMEPVRITRAYLNSKVDYQSWWNRGVKK